MLIWIVLKDPSYKRMQTELRDASISYSSLLSFPKKSSIQISDDYHRDPLLAPKKLSTDSFNFYHYYNSGAVGVFDFQMHNWACDRLIDGVY